MVIKVNLKMSEVFFILPPAFLGGGGDVWLISLFDTEWCDQKYHTILYTTVVAVCSQGNCQLSFTAV